MREQLEKQQHVPTIYDGLIELTKNIDGVPSKVLHKLYEAAQCGLSFDALVEEQKLSPMPTKKTQQEAVIGGLLTEAYIAQGTARRLEAINDARAKDARRSANQISKIVGVYGTDNPDIRKVHDAVLSANAQGIKRSKDTEGSFVVADHAKAVWGRVPEAVDYRPGAREANKKERAQAATTGAMARTALTVGLAGVIAVTAGNIPANAADQTPQPQPKTKSYSTPNPETVNPLDKTQPAHINFESITPPTQVKVATTEIEPIESAPTPAVVSTQPTSIEKIVEEPVVTALTSNVRMSTKDLGSLTMEEITGVAPQDIQIDTVVGPDTTIVADTAGNKPHAPRETVMPSIDGIEIGGEIRVVPPKPNTKPKTIIPDVTPPGDDSDSSGLELTPVPIKMTKPPKQKKIAPEVDAPGAIEFAPAPDKEKPAETKPEAPKPAPEAPAPAPAPEAPAPIPEVIIDPAFAGETHWTSTDLEFIRDNLDMYTNVEKQTGMPWEVVVSLHYREASMAMANPNNEQGLFQLYSLYMAGERFSPGPITREEFTRQAVMAADFLKGKAHELGYTDDQITLANPDVIKDILFSYNGRAGAYGQQARNLGFDKPAEGSPYVMNLADDQRNSNINPNWGQILTDGGSLGKANQQPGAWPLIQGLQHIEKKAHDAAVAAAQPKPEEPPVAPAPAPQPPVETIVQPTTGPDVIKMFNQCDPRWGNIISPNGQKACNIACGPTNVAMIASMIKPELAITPQDTIQFANDHRLWFTPAGGAPDSGGTTFDAVVKLAANWGIEGNQMGNQWIKDFNKYKELINEGAYIIAAGSGPAPFVMPDVGAHFVSIVGTTDDGKFLVADPYPKTPGEGIVAWDAQQMLQSTFGAVVLYEQDTVTASGSIDEVMPPQATANEQALPSSDKSEADQSMTTKETAGDDGESEQTDDTSEVATQPSQGGLLKIDNSPTAKDIQGIPVDAREADADNSKAMQSQQTDILLEEEAIDAAARAAVESAKRTIALAQRATKQAQDEQQLVAAH